MRSRIGATRIVDMLSGERRMQTQRFLITGGSQGIGAAIVSRRARPDTRWCSPAATTRTSSGRRATPARTASAPTSSSTTTTRASSTPASSAWAASTCSSTTPAFGYRAEIGALDVDAMRALFATNVFGAGRPHQPRRAADEGARRRRHRQPRVDVGHEGREGRHRLRRQQVGGARHHASAGRPSCGRTASA